jgi:tetratricopeptide (TPR) repeat protein
MKQTPLACMKEIAMSMAIFVYSASAASADNKYMEQGIKEYNAGDYMSAVGHLGEAESQDFNDAKLHYYLANAFVRIKQLDAAIREYRIGFALEPDGPVGAMCKQALDLCQPALATTGKDNKTATHAPAPVLDPVLKQALDHLQSQREDLKSNQSTTANSQAATMGKFTDAQSEALRKNTQDVIDSLRGTRRSSGAVQQAQQEMTARQDLINRAYQSQKTNSASATKQRASAIEESEANLEKLLNETPKAGTVRLAPAGTNLYIRNYVAPDTDLKPPAGQAPYPVQEHAKAVQGAW